MPPKPADPSTDWLGERAWKAIARQAALDTCSYILRAQGHEQVTPANQRALVDAILGTIGQAYEAAIRDAVLRFMYDRLGMAGREPEPPSQHPFLLPIQAPDGYIEDVLRFLWRQIPADEMEQIRGR
jgi:hypothetical protein